MDPLHIPASAQSQDGQGLGQPGLVESVPAHRKRWNKMSFEIASNPIHAGIL